MTAVSKLNRGRRVLLLVVAMLILAALACGGGDEPEAEPTEEPAAEEEVAEAEPTKTPEPVGGNLDIVNESGDSICFVYISPAGSGDWGDDQLGAENVIEAGGTHTITGIEPGAYDIRVDDCNNETVHEQTGTKLGAADFAITVSAAEETAEEGNQLILENTSGIEICYLYIALPTDDTWGNNQLDEGDSVPSGSTYTIWGIPPGTYDLRVETCQSDPNSRQSAERVGVDLTEDFTWTIEPSEEGAKLVLVNNSGALLCYLYIALPSDDTWGNNQLPEGTQVRTGTNFTITGIPPGTYDLRVETCESDPDMRVYLEAYDNSIQTEFTWTINP